MNPWIPGYPRIPWSVGKYDHSIPISVSYRICMHGGQSGICKFLKGAGTKSHLFIRCVSGFSRGALEGAGGGKCAPYHPLYETLPMI